MAKKIFALVATVVLVVCFSVTAFATPVINTTTKYVNGKADVEVKVTGVTAGDNVTYYATNGTTPVFVDQKEADSTGATFNFVTDKGNVGSAVVVGYTGGNNDAAKEQLPDADKYSITYDGEELAQVYLGEGATVEIDNPATDIQTVKSVKANGVEVAFNEIGDKISVTLSNVTGDVVITVVCEDKPIDDYDEELEAVDAGAVLVKASTKPEYQGGIKIDGIHDDAGNEIESDEERAKVNANKIGDRKLTVCGKAGNYDEVGIIVATSPIEAGNYRETAFNTLGVSYVAQTIGTDGRFAVQLIDVSTDTDGVAFVVSGETYYTAVYGYSEANQAYYVKSYADPVTVD